MAELEPCPFCGKDANIQISYDYMYNVGKIKLFRAGCVSCRIFTQFHYSEDAACADWNRRFNNDKR